MRVGIVENRAIEPLNAGAHRAPKEAKQEQQAPKGAKTKAEEKP